MYPNIQRPAAQHKKCIGMIGGLGAIAGADVFYKLVKAAPAKNDACHFDIVLEQHGFHEDDVAGEENANLNARKLYVFDMIRQFEQRDVTAIMLPCFLSHTFIDELRAEIKLPIIHIMAALRSHMETHYPAQRRLGILTSDYVKKMALFENTFIAPHYELVYPDAEMQQEGIMQALYGGNGIKRGHLQGASIELLYQACQNLLAQGAQVILPGATEIAVVADALRERGIPIVDANQAYAQYAVDYQDMVTAQTFKVGIVGGVGPAATVDFMNKIIKNTPARRDQEHIKLLVEHNPQIPDRTHNLIANGPDPTIALYSACRKLEAGEADIIAIPCNTAHAYVTRMASRLSVPIVNMLTETAAFIRTHYNADVTVGLLATSGTIASRVYHDAMTVAGITMIVPDDVHQQRVMDAIYGEAGVKAGFTSGRCCDDLLAAMLHLADRGAQVVVLGCTELPLLQQQTDALEIGEKTVAVLDPTEILARKCVSLSLQRKAG